MALVFWASFNLSAILNLILFMGTLVSVRVPLIPSGAFLDTTWLEDAPEDAGGVTGAATGGGVAGVGAAF